MTKNQVVLHFTDSTVLKGFVYDFVPTKEHFHIADANDEHDVTEVSTSELKAIFFVKSLEGDPDRPCAPEPTPDQLQRAPGIKLRITFADGEVLTGSTTGFSRERKGFFIIPLDPQSNNERIYVVMASTTSIETLTPAVVGSRP